MRANFNITDDKIRFDPEGIRLTDEQHKQAKACNFAWWPGRKIFVAKWSVSAEDFVLSLVSKIEEDDTLDDVESRVERYQKHATEAESNAERSAEYSLEATTARRRELLQNRAENEAEKALYWTRRISGAIERATYREQPGVIARRIKSIEAEKRKYEKESVFHRAFLATWEKQNGDLTVEYAKNIANYDRSHTWFDLDRGTITAQEAKEKSINHHTGIIETLTRQIEHANNRLEYERALLSAAGGLPTDSRVWEVGGAAMIGGRWCEIAKVNRTTFNARYEWDNTKGYTKHDKTVAHNLMTVKQWQAYQRGEYTPEA